MNGIWTTKVPPREEKPVLDIPASQIDRINAIKLFRAASGLGLYDSKQLIDVNFPRDQQPQRYTLDIQALCHFIAAWRVDNLRGFV
jgi:hypothetical protein